MTHAVARSTALLPECPAGNHPASHNRSRHSRGSRAQRSPGEWTFGGDAVGKSERAEQRRHQLRPSIRQPCEGIVEGLCGCCVSGPLVLHHQQVALLSPTLRSQVLILARVVPPNRSPAATGQRHDPRDSHSTGRRPARPTSTWPVCRTPVGLSYQQPRRPAPIPRVPAVAQLLGPIPQPPEVPW